MNRLGWMLVLLVTVCLATTALGLDRADKPRRAVEPPDLSAQVYPVTLTDPPVVPLSELDEYDFGDTTVVEITFWDSQHNATIGRQIQYDPAGAEGTGMVYFIYSDLPNPGGVRKANANKVGFDENGDPIVLMTGGTVLGGGDWSGYPTLALNPTLANQPPAFLFHQRANASGPYLSRIAGEFAFLPDIFFDEPLPFDGADWNAWPRSAMDDEAITHVVTTPNEVGNLLYYRYSMDNDGGTFTALTEQEQILELDDHFPGSDVAVSPNGDRVAIGTPLSRGHLGIVEETRAWDNDFVVWLNEEGGDNWDWSLEDALNVTQFQGPDYSQLPDTVAANQDTFRLWLDCNLYFDHESNLHGAWSAAEYFYIQDQGYVYAQIFYWNEVNNEYIRVGDGSFWNNWNTQPSGTNNLLVGRPNMVRDPDSGWLYLVYESYGVAGDTTDAGQPLDVGQSGMPNAELFLTASPTGSAEWGRDFEVNGRLWFQPLNITNTRSLSPDPIAPGNCRSETDPSLALHAEGDYLHLFMTVDRDAGTFIFQEGTQTDNPLVYYRLDKDA
ncbi:hypothetical protein GF324_09840, partial [bacterium]|nr:hypothetical protein [bacterium]